MSATLASRQYDDAQAKPPPSRIEVVTIATVVTEIRETNSLLRRVILALEMLHGKHIPDPAG